MWSLHQSASYQTFTRTGFFTAKFFQRACKYNQPKLLKKQCQWYKTTSFLININKTKLLCTYLYTYLPLYPKKYSLEKAKLRHKLICDKNNVAYMWYFNRARKKLHNHVRRPWHFATLHPTTWCRMVHLPTPHTEFVGI